MKLPTVAAPVSETPVGSIARLVQAVPAGLYSSIGIARLPAVVSPPTAKKCPFGGKKATPSLERTFASGAAVSQASDGEAWRRAGADEVVPPGTGPSARKRSRDENSTAPGRVLVAPELAAPPARAANPATAATAAARARRAEATRRPARNIAFT